MLIVNPNSDLCNKIINISDLKNKDIYIPRGDTESSDSFIKMLKENKIENNIRRIDSVSISNIIQKHDCVGFVNRKYLEKELKDKSVIKIETEFKIMPTTYGLYFHIENESKELRNFISVLKDSFK